MIVQELSSLGGGLHSPSALVRLGISYSNINDRDQINN